jgi:prophage tail gpP-like protein
MAFPNLPTGTNQPPDTSGNDFIGPIFKSGDKPSAISLVVGGFEYTGWERATVNYAATDAARAFAFTLTDADNTAQAWDLLPGDEDILVLIDGEVVVTGHIDTMSPSYAATNHTIEVSGRSLSADVIDSSHTHPTSEFSGQTLAQIAAALAPDGISITSDMPLNAIPNFRLQPAETIFAALDRAAAKSGLFLQGTADGGIKITKGGSRVVHPPLVEGQNILAGSATFNNTDRHTTYRVHGQRAFDQASKKTLQIQATAVDHSMRRKRNKVIVAETDVSQQEAQTLADWHRDRQLGESIKAHIRVVGTRDANGRLWQVNTLIFVQSPMLRLAMQMVIQNVAISQDKSGTFTALSLVHPLALASPAAVANRGEAPDPEVISKATAANRAEVNAALNPDNITNQIWLAKHTPIANPVGG